MRPEPCRRHDCPLCGGRDEPESAVILLAGAFAIVLAAILLLVVLPLVVG